MVLAFVFLDRLPAALVFERADVAVEVPPDQTEVVGVFRFKNMGSETIMILEVQTGCPCVSARLERRRYKASESGDLVVSFRFPINQATDTARIKVITDEDKEPVYGLTLTMVRTTSRPDKKGARKGVGF